MRTGILDFFWGGGANKHLRELRGCRYLSIQSEQIHLIKCFRGGGGGGGAGKTVFSPKPLRILFVRLDLRSTPLPLPMLSLSPWLDHQHFKMTLGGMVVDTPVLNPFPTSTD